MLRNLLFALLAVTQISGAMPRNPFQPLITPCAALKGRLAKWQLYGVVSSASGAVAIVQDPQKRWRRIITGMDTEPDAAVSGIFQQQVSIALPAECEPSVYTWTIIGANHGMDASTGTAGGLAAGKPGG